jgi:magnesium-transporting ATPase (P-type)
MLVVRKYWFENSRQFILILLATAAFFVLWMGVHLSFGNPNLLREEIQIAYFFTGLFLAGCLSAGIHFSSLGAKPTAIHYLLTPASSKEKFFCALLFGVLLFFAGYVMVFYAVDSVAVSIANLKFNTHWKIANLLVMDSYENRLFDGPYSNLLYFYFVAQAFFLLASIYFSKNGLFKAIVGVGILWVIVIFIVMSFFASFPPGVIIKSIGEYSVLEQSGLLRTIAISPAVTAIVLIFYKFMITPLLWYCAYLRLEEKHL